MTEEELRLDHLEQYIETLLDENKLESKHYPIHIAVAYFRFLDDEEKLNHIYELCDVVAKSPFIPYWGDHTLDKLDKVSDFIDIYRTEENVTKYKGQELVFVVNTLNEKFKLNDSAPLIIQ